MKYLGLAAAGVAWGGGSPGQAEGNAATAAAAKAGPVPKRKLGRHLDVEVSSIAIGGHALALAATEEESHRIAAEAIDSGVNFFDNAWDYHHGRGEEVMGRALKGKRDQVFLMTKLCTHGKGGPKEVAAFLDQSLTRLQTDHLDLWQLHALATKEQVEAAFRDDVLAAMVKARDAGKTRFIGFTGHTDPEVHLAMLAHHFPFDTCQMPLSAIEANSNAFVRRVLPELLKQNIAPLAMKTLGGDAKSIHDGVLTVEEALRYSLSLPVTAVVSGITSVEFLRQNVKVAREFQPMKPAEMLALEQRCLPASKANLYEPYRQWMSYRDGDAASRRAAVLA